MLAAKMMEGQRAVRKCGRKTNKYQSIWSKSRRILTEWRSKNAIEKETISNYALICIKSIT